MSIITHSGKFHADELMAIAILHAVVGGQNIIRTRDMSLVVDGDILVDVGGIYDPTANRFDHHQKDSPKHLSGRSYSSCGMVWLAYGRDQIKIMAEANGVELTSPQIDVIWENVDHSLISAIDKQDTGESDPSGFSFSSALGSYNTFNETDGEDRCFMEALTFAKQILRNVLAEATKRVVEAEYVRNADTMFDGKVIVLGRGVPWIETVVAESKFDNAEFVMFPHIDGVTWRLQAIPKELGSFEKRRSLPDAWAGHSGQDLEYITGVKGAVFCHKALFICGANSFEAMVDMAELATQ